MAEKSAYNEVFQAAVDNHWDVSHKGTHTFRTYSLRTRAGTNHELQVLSISPSDKQIEAEPRSYSTSQRPFVVLFKASGAFHTAFRAGWDGALVVARSAAASEAEAYRRQQYSEERITELTAERHAGALYGTLSASRHNLSKADVLKALVVDDGVRRGELHAQQEAKLAEQNRAKLVERQTNDFRAVKQHTEEAVAALEEVKAALRESHPRLAEAPGFVDSIIFTLVGEKTDPQRPLYKFLQARGGIEQAQASFDRITEELEAQA